MGFWFINTIETLIELGFFLVNTIIALLNGGKHNEASISKYTMDYLKSLGFVNTVDTYDLFKIDFDLYCNQVYKLETPIYKN